MLKTVGNPSLRSGDQTIINGNLVIGTAGKGIDFSAASHATGMTSELLNDYEEGTWTPIIQGSSTAGTGTYSSANGYYTKVGRQITVHFWIYWTAHTGTGNLQIAGFPFASANLNNGFANGCFGEVANLTLSANNVIGGFSVMPNSSYAVVYQQPVGGVTSGQVAMDSAAYMMGSVTYFTA